MPLESNGIVARVSVSCAACNSGCVLHATIMWHEISASVSGSGSRRVSINRNVCWRKQACCIVLRVGALRWASLDGARDWLILAIGKPTRLQFSSEVRVPGPEGPEETSSTAAELRIMLPFADKSSCNCMAVRQRLGLKRLLTRWLVGDAGWIS